MSTREPLNLCSCVALRQAARHVTRLYDEALRPLDLGLNQYSILSRLDRYGPSTIQDLARRLVMDRSTLGHLLRPLERRGIVSIGTSATDRRRRLLALTDEGEALLARARPLWASAEHRFETAFGCDEAAALRAMMLRAVSTDFGTGKPSPLTASP